MYQRRWPQPFIALRFQMAQHAILGLSANTPQKDADKDVAPSTESYAEEYARTIQAVSSELYLDGLRQEVSCV